MKKTLLRLSLLAVLLVACISFTSVSATTELNDLKLVLEVPSASVDANEAVIATVKVANTNVSKFNIAGLQVSLAYDSESLEFVQTLNQMGSGTLAVSNTENSTVKFAAVKDDFAENGCYTTLGTNGVLFTVEFKANKQISDPTTLFSKDGLTFLFGDTDALKVNADSVYGGNIQKIAEALLNSDVEILANTTAGNVAVIPTDTVVTEQWLKEQLSDEDATLTPAFTDADTGVSYFGTGAKITVDGQEVEIVVKGDIDGDGTSDVFDANIAAKGTELSGARAYAAEQDGADSILNHATKGTFLVK